MRWGRWLGVVAALAALWPGMSLAQTSTSFKFHTAATTVTPGAVMSAANFSTIAVQVEGTFVGTLIFEKKTKDAAAYVAVQCTNAADRTVSATTTTAPGYWECPGGAFSFRVRISAYTSGTITVTGLGTMAVAGRGSGGGGGGTAQGLDANFDIQPVINGAIPSNPFRFGDGVSGQTDICGYTDPTLGAVLKPCTDTHTRSYIWPDFNWELYDIEGSSPVIVADPDAFGTGSGTVTMQTGEQFVGSNLGMEFNESDANPTCSGGNYTIYADTSEASLKYCNNGTAYKFFNEFIIRKTSDETRTNTTTLTNDAALLFAASANSTYAIKLFLLYDSSQAADFNYNFSLPAGATGWKSSIASGNTTTICAGSTSVTYSYNDIVQQNNNVGGAGTGTANICTAMIEGTIVTAGTAGMVNFKWAQATADASTSTVRANSWMSVRLLP